MDELLYKEYLNLTRRHRHFFHKLHQRNQSGRTPLTKSVSIFADEYVRRIYDDLCKNFARRDLTPLLRSYIQNIVIFQAANSDKCDTRSGFTLSCAFSQAELECPYDLMEGKKYLIRRLGFSPPSIPDHKLESLSHEFLIRKRHLLAMKLALTKELFPRQEADTLFGNIEREFGPLLDFEILLKIFHDFGTNQLESIDGEISKEQISSLMNENEVLLAVLRKRRNPLGQKYRRWVRPYIDVLRELIRIRSSEEERNFLRKSFHQILQEKGWGDFFPIVDYETQAGYKDLIDRYMSSRLPSRLETYEQKFNLKLIEYSPEGKQAGQIIDKIMCLISQELDVHNVRPRYDWVIRIVNHLHLPYFHSFFYGKTQALSLNKKTIEYVKKRIQRVRT